MYNCLLCGQCSNCRYCIQAVPQQLGYAVPDYDEEWQYTCDAVGGHSGAPITVNASGYIGILAVSVHGYNTFHYCTCRSHNSSTPQVTNSRVTFVTMSASCKQCLGWIESISHPFLFHCWLQFSVLSSIHTCTQSLDPVSYILPFVQSCAVPNQVITSVTKVKDQTWSEVMRTTLRFPLAGDHPLNHTKTN